MGNTKGFGRDIPPLEKHVIVYFLEKKMIDSQALSFYKYHQKRKWKNRAGKTIRNWKTVAWQWILDREDHK